MKRILTLMLALMMVLSFSIYAFADDEVCELTEEEKAYMLEVKSKFLGDKVADGTLTQAEADALFEALKNETHNQSLRGLGFGAWVRDSEYADKISEIMPHKNGYDRGNGERKFDGSGQRRGGRGQGCNR